MSSLDLSNSFEYLCYGSMAIKIMYSYSAGIDFSRQTKVDPRTVRVNLCVAKVVLMQYY